MFDLPHHGGGVVGLLAVLLLGGFGVAHMSGSPQATSASIEDYPIGNYSRNVEQRFLASCGGAGATELFCTCTLSRIEQRLSRSAFVYELSYFERSGGVWFASSPFGKAAASCQGL